MQIKIAMAAFFGGTTLNSNVSERARARASELGIASVLMSLDHAEDKREGESGWRRENGGRGVLLHGGESFFRFTNWFNFFSKSG